LRLSLKLIQARERDCNINEVFAFFIKNHDSVIVLEPRLRGSMGGYGSGRSGGRLTTDNGLTLTLSKLFRDGIFRPGSDWGSLVWTNTATGKRIGSISYEAHLGQESGRVRLYYTTTRYDGEKRDSDYWIQLETTPQPFGGRRWWFVCPRTGRRATKLYLPNGAFTFASRQAYRLAYRSQREASHDRALRRAFKLRGNLGAKGGIGDFVPKPKWMRWRTYDRAMARIDRAEEAVEAHTALLLDRLKQTGLDILK
jgi:hypothetical protein